MPSGDALRRFVRRAVASLRADLQDDEASREIAAHLQLLQDKFVAEGMSCEDARLAARRAFGNVDAVRVEHRDARSFRWLASWWPDLKLGGRMLRKYPGLTLVGGAAMAFAIAVGAAGFEVLSQIVHPRLPLDDSGRLVAIELWDTAANRAEPRATSDFVVWREGLASVEDLGAFTPLARNLIVDGRSEPVAAAAISASAFRVARIPPLLGRPLVDSDERPGAADVVVIGYDVWQSRVAGAADVIGRRVTLGDTPAVIVGVMPDGFAFPATQEAWVPLRLDAAPLARRAGSAIRVFGRLAAGASIEQAQNEAAALSRRLSDDPDAQHLRPLVSTYAQSVAAVRDEESLALWSINIFLVLLVVLASSNVALLMFARAASRDSEIVVRSALGASRGRIVSQLFAEALVLGGVALVAGLSAAQVLLQWWMRVVAVGADGRVPFWFSDRVSPETVIYAGALMCLGAAIAGAVPALKATSRRLEPHLRASGGRATWQIGGVWTAIIVAQVAITVAFPAATFFVRRGVVQLQSFDVGFAAHEYLSARLEVEQSTDRARFTNLVAELEQRLAANADVAGTTFTNRLPRTVHDDEWIEVEDVDATVTVPTRVNVAAVSPNFFAVLDAPMLAGRPFTAADRTSAPPVIVNADFVRVVLGGRNAIGRRLRFRPDDRRASANAAPAPGPWMDIVGVARTLATIHDDPTRLAGVYQPLAIDPATPLHMAIHVNGDPQAFVPRLRAIAAALDPTLRLYDVRRLDEAGAEMWNEFDFLWRVLVLASAIALLLSLAGIYAVMSFVVARQTREIGIRVALGANARQVAASALARPIAQVGAGIITGGSLIALVSWLALGGLSLREVALVVVYAIVMMMVCLLAGVVPTRRALSIEPTEALRE